MMTSRVQKEDFGDIGNSDLDLVIAWHLLHRHAYLLENHPVGLASIYTSVHL